MTNFDSCDGFVCEYVDKCDNDNEDCTSCQRFNDCDSCVFNPLEDICL